MHVAIYLRGDGITILKFWMHRPLPKERCEWRTTNLFFMQHRGTRASRNFNGCEWAARACQLNCVGPPSPPRYGWVSCKGVSVNKRDTSLWWFRTMHRLHLRLYLHRAIFIIVFRGADQFITFRMSLIFVTIVTNRTFNLNAARGWINVTIASTKIILAII